jgi:hypothetical protein
MVWTLQVGASFREGPCYKQGMWSLCDPHEFSASYLFTIHKVLSSMDSVRMYLNLVVHIHTSSCKTIL